MDEEPVPDRARVLGESISGGLVAVAALSDPGNAPLYAGAQPFLARMFAAGAESLGAGLSQLIFHASGDDAAVAEQLVKAVETSPRARGLLTDAWNAAATTDYSRKIRVLGEAFRRGALYEDDVTIDIEQAVIRAVAPLERAHVTVLMYLHEKDTPVVDLQAQFPKYTGVLDGLIATLERGGLVLRGSPTTVGATRPTNVYVTAFGSLLQERFRHADKEIATQ